MPRRTAPARIAQEEQQVRGDLVVAAAARVQAARHGAGQLVQPGLHVHVDVLGRRVEGEPVRLDLLQDEPEPGHQGLRVVGRDEPGSPQHAGVGDRPADVVAGQGPIEVDRGREPLDSGIGGLAEASAPGLAARVGLSHAAKSREDEGVAQPGREGGRPCGRPRPRGSRLLPPRVTLRPGERWLARAKRRAKRGRRRPPPRRDRSGPGGWRRVAALVVLVGGFGVGFLVGGRLVQLDRVVVSRFEGQRFRVPSRVLSAPTILYPGVDIERIGLRNLLDRLGYRSEVQRGRLDLGRLAIGHQAWAKGGARVHLRGFDHPTRPERPRDVLLRLDGKVVREIRELPEGRPLGAVLLEPEPVGSYYGPDREQRDLVQLADVPQHLVDAILAVEDQRFQSHHGVDVRRIVGAAIANVRAGSIRQGGSTLTQQLAKNFFLSHDRTLRRKLDEAAMAMIMEARYAKDEILEAYLNEIYLGQRGATAVHGVGEAARYYFGKPVPAICGQPSRPCWRRSSRAPTAPPRSATKRRPWRAAIWCSR